MFRRKTLWKISIYLFIFPYLISSCSHSEPIKIGYIGGLTGLLSDLGVNGRDGVLLAVEEVNRSGGILNRPVELIVKDDKHDPNTARDAVQELLRNEVEAIIGHMNSAMSISTIPIINEAQTLMISPSTSTNTLTGIDDYFFRISAPNEMMMDVLSEYIVHDTGIRRIACVYDLTNLAYTGEMFEKFRDKLRNEGGVLTAIETFSAGSNDSFFTLARSLADSKPDGYFILAGSFATAMICQQLRKLGVEEPVFTSGWAGTTDLIQYGGPAVEGIFMVEEFNKESVQPEYLAFRRKFLQSYGREPGFAAAYGYEAATVLFAAMRKDLELNDLKHTILEIGSFPGLDGDLIIDEYGDTKIRCYLGSVENGKFITLREFQKD